MISPCEPLNTPLNKFCNIRIKRDDLFPSTGGGNKSRKIHYIVSDALAKGYNAIVTNGGINSNHARATALACAQNKIKCSLVLHSDKPTTSFDLSGNLLLMKMAGADIQFCKLSSLSLTMDQEVTKLKEQGYKPLYLWGGGHCVQGSLAYYYAAKETQAQCAEWIPDYVIHASGTGTTQAGLIAGYANYPTKIIGISVAREKNRGTNIIRQSLIELGFFLNTDFSNSKIDFRDDWLMGGYEQTSTQLLEVINKTALTGLILDPTYTGKAYLAMIELIKKQELPIQSKILFWHTGGLLNLLTSPDYLTKI